MEPTTTDATPVWANSSSTAIHHALTPWAAAGSLSATRVVLEMRNRVGDIQVQAFIQYADDDDDPSTWSAPTNLGSTLSADGITASSFSAVTAGKKRRCRFGARAINTSTSSLNLAHVTLRVERRDA